MDESLDQFKSLLGVVADFGTEVAVVEGAEIIDDAIDKLRGEDALSLVNGAVALKDIGAGGTAVGQHIEAVEDILRLEDVDAHVAVFGILDSVFHFESVARRHRHASQKQVNIGATVGSAQLDGLLVAEIDIVV